ncbi:MAG TPA: VTT domain-containing protein [Thermoleophilaceae bacterium]
MSVTPAVVGSLGSYAALFALMALSWAGIPVAGQPALVAAGVLASQHELSIVVVIAVGIAASAIGGVGAYLIGLHGGRTAIAADGPFRRARLRALDRGDELFDKYGPAAVFFAPMWLAGIHRMHWPSFLVWNALASVAWTLVAALGGYLVGPAIADILEDTTLVVVGVAVAILVGAALYRRRRRARGREAGEARARPPAAPDA